VSNQQIWVLLPSKSVAIPYTCGSSAGTTPRSPSPAPSSSSQEDRRFEFLLRINDDPLGIKRLPNKFAEFFDGVEPA
jgi:hypothetical protein